MIADNLKFLRKYYKETQQELADYLGVSQNTLSDYEKEKIAIPDDLISKIAHHYIISRYELTHFDLSQEDVQAILPKASLIKYFRLLFPIVKDSTVEGDKYFFQGSIQAGRVLTRFESSGELDVFLLTSCLASYRTSWELTKNHASIANYISLSLLYCACISEQSNALNNAIFSEQQLNYLDIKNVILQNQYSTKVREEIDKRKHAFFDEYDQKITEYIKQLKSSSCFWDLADYFLAVVYFVGFVDNDFDSETNQRVFLDIIFRLYKLENKYATSLISQIEEIS